MTDNLDFLTALLHGRRSGLAEGARLDALCRLRTLPQLARELPPGPEVESAIAVQRRLVRALAREVAGVALHLAGAGGELLRWLAVRFQVENLKVLFRGVLTGMPPGKVRPYLVELPSEVSLDIDRLASAASLDEFVQFLPPGPLRLGVAKTAASQRDQPRPFFFEAALDQGYFQELLARAGRLAEDDAELVGPMVTQEADTFHLLLVARGKFQYDLEAGSLLRFHVPGAGISRGRLAAMLAETELRGAATHALRRALDDLPRESTDAGAASAALQPAALEARAWDRFRRLANRAFRRSHMGLAAVVAYVELRRVELANLITLSEGIRSGTTEETIRARLAPRLHSEVAHV